MSVIGVDFGTKSCVISQAKRGGIDTVLNENSKRQTPALVSFQGKQRFMGEGAAPLMSSNFKNTVVLVKRFVGRNWSDPSVQADIATCPNKKFFRELPGDKIGIEVSYQDETMTFSPEEICAMLMGSLRRTAEFANEGRPVSDMVFSVPAFWTDRQRRAFLAAAKMAEVDVLGLINDGTAAALSYGIWKSAGNQFDAEKRDYVMFVDMGYASFQVTIAAYVQGKLTIVASASDPNLGGRDIDMVLAKHFAAEFNEKHKADPLGNPKAMLKLLNGCEKLKQTLTPDGVGMANINVEFLLNETDLRGQLSLDEFNKLIEPLVERVQAPLERAMEESELTMDKISAVEIIGGSTRVRAVKKKISEVLGLDESRLNFGLSTTQNADECVSRGCALQCAMLSPAFRVKPFVVADTISVPITVNWEQVEAASSSNAMETDDGVDATGENFIKLFDRGLEIPKVRRITFRRSEPFEVTACFDEGAKELFPTEEDRTIGKFFISGMPAVEGEVPRIRVDFKQDEFGLFKLVSAEQMQEVKSEQPSEGKEAGEGKEEAAAPSEGDSAAEGKAAEADKPVKKKFKPYKLKVESAFFKGFLEKDIIDARTREKKFREHDKLLEDTSAMKNKLEAYVYSMRDKIDTTLKSYGTDDERSKLSSALQEAENWLYDEGYDETKAVYEKRLAELEDLGSVFVARKDEDEARPAAANRLRDEIGANLKVANSEEDKYAHLEDEDRDKVREACNAAEKWLEEKLDAQSERNLHEEPVIKASEIDSRVKDLHSTCRPIVTKPKPAPKKEEKAAADEEKAAADEEKAAADEEKAAADEEKAAADEEKAAADEEGAEEASGDADMNEDAKGEGKAKENDMDLD